MSARRGIALAAGLAGVVVFGLLSVTSGLAQRRPGSGDPPGAGAGWIVGTRHDRLEAAAEHHIREALASLKDANLPVADRRSKFRRNLERARDLLELSLRACPAQAGALATLAAVRWELDPFPDRKVEAGTLAIARLAGERAPRVPSVQWTLGEVLVRMGHAVRALEHLSRAVRLDPARTEATVSLLREHRVSPQRILDALPESARVAASLQEDFFRAGQSDMLIDYLETRVRATRDRPGPAGGAPSGATDPAEPTDWIAAYAEVCLRAGRPARLVSALSEPTPDESVGMRAEILMQRSRGLSGMGRDEEAWENARAASELLPDDGRILMNLGRIGGAAQRHADALDAYERALAIAAATPWPETSRAWVYSEIGKTHEAMLRPDLAWDAYTRALALDAGREDARERIEAIRSLSNPGAPARDEDPRAAGRRATE